MLFYEIVRFKWTAKIDDQLNLLISFNYIFNQSQNINSPKSLMKVKYNLIDKNMKVISS